LADSPAAKNMLDALKFSTSDLGWIEDLLEWNWSLAVAAAVAGSF
jgi:hypothetical protein